MGIMSFQHFRRLAQSIDVTPILAEIRASRELWYLNQVRRQTVRDQAETNNIALRRGVTPDDKSVSLDDSQRVEETKNWARFPHTTALLTKFAGHEQGELARAMLVRLKPQGRVLSHVDRGAYYACRDRYHLVIQSPGGSEMGAGGEWATFQAGDLWCFNNKVVHEALNRSTDWRVHLIFDLLPQSRPLRFGAPRKAAG